MSEWKEYKLGEIASFVTEKVSVQDVKLEDYISTENMLPDKGGIIVASNKPQEGSATKYFNDTILISNIRPYFKKIWYADKVGGCSNDVLCFKAKDELVFSKYLYFLLSQDTFFDYVMLGSKGCKMPRGDKSHIMNWEISIPPLPTQHRIASILTSLDDKIDLLRRENATLEAMAETLFRQWFVVEAKEEWKEGKLGDYVIETIGGEWGKENPEGDFIKPVQCIRGTDIADLSVGLATKTPIRYVKESKFEKIEPRNGDIIMEISGGTENQSTGRVAYINEDVKKLFDYPIIFSNFCRLLRVEEEHTYFIYCYLKYLYDQDEFFNLENGSSGIKNLDYKALLYELTYPMPNDRQRILDFNDKVSVYFEKSNRNKQQIQTLIQTRDGLLPRLMGGEITL